jgi:hypothetical protein
MRTTRALFRLRSCFRLGILLSAFAPARLPATIIESFDDGAVVSLTADGTATATGTFVSGQVGLALHNVYDLGTGNFIVLGRDLTGQDFLENSNGVRFSYRAEGVVNTLELVFMDDDGVAAADKDQLYHKQLLQTDNVWREVFLPFSDFKFFSEGDGSFDIDAVTLLKIGVTRENGNTGSGTLFVDDIDLVFRRDFTTTLDTFESGAFSGGVSSTTRNTDLNFFAGGATGAGSAVYVTSQAASGARALELNYSVTGAGFVGIEMETGGLVVPDSSNRLEFKAKGASGGEPLLIKIVTGAGTLTRNISSYGALTTSYQTFSIPISDFTGSIDRNSVSAFKFELGDAAGTGTIYLDDVFLKAAGTGSDATVRAVEDFQLDKPLTNFTQSAGVSSATITFDVIKDVTAPGAAADNRVARIGYEFLEQPAIPFAVIERALRPNLHAEPVVKFRFKGTGANNSLEFKLVDADGTTYIRKFAGVTNTNGAWKTASIPVEDLSLFSAGAGDSDLDLRNIARAEFAVVRLGGAEGTLTLDELESTIRVAFEKPGVGSVLSRVSTPNNPFSPNGDGVQDTAKFLFTLAQAARVQLRLYDLRGVPLKTFDLGDLTAGEHAAEWDGVDDDGRRVSNGLYLFRLEADGANGPTDVFKEIIGVLR